MTLRQIRFEGETAYVPLTRGFEAVIDAEDAHLVEGFNWVAHVHPLRHGVYAVRSTGPRKDRKSLHMHRIIAGDPKGLFIDHIDGNTLNNRKDNLRTATHSQNNRNRVKYANNTSGYKGVSQNSRTGAWVAHIRVDGRRINIGSYKSKEEASEAYCVAARMVHGRFANVGESSPLEYSHGVLWKALTDILSVVSGSTDEQMRRIAWLAEEAMWHDTYSNLQPTPLVYNFSTEATQ